MRFFFYCIVSLLIGCGTSQKSITPLPKTPVATSPLYLVKSIDSIEDVYIIYVMNKQDSIYKIVSVKDSLKSLPCSNIQVGGSYNLSLSDIRQIIYTRGSVKDTAYIYHGSCFLFGKKESVRICTQQDRHYAPSLYKATNLIGLCLKP
jgi:hypothetical protein